jgi:hypothetical protein
MTAYLFCGSGFTRALLLSEYKADQLGLQRDGAVITAAAAGGSQLTLHRSVSSMLIGGANVQFAAYALHHVCCMPFFRCGSVSVAVCVQDNSGKESHINEHLLGKTATVGLRTAVTEQTCATFPAFDGVLAECWVMEGTSAPSSTIQRITLTPTVLDANCFNDCALTIAVRQCLKCRNIYVGIAGMNAALVQLAPS